MIFTAAQTNLQYSSWVVVRRESWRGVWVFAARDTDISLD